MAGPDPIFDKALLRRRLARAAARAPADFLLTRAAADIAERLETVQRNFAIIADTGSPGSHLTRALAARWPEALVAQVAPIAAPLAAGDRPVVVGDAEWLCLKSQSLDLAVSALALQTSNDLPGALIQIRQALKPDGLFLGALLGGSTLHELRTVLTEAESHLLNGASPRVAPFADIRDMGGLLQRAGFALPVADSETVTVRYDNLFALMADLRAMGATNALVARSRRPTPRGVFLEAAKLYRDRFGDGDGRLRATFEIISVSGWAPHASQQQPARRGSGQVSLASVLEKKKDVAAARRRALLIC